MSSSYCRRMVSLCLSDACSSRASRLPRRATSLFSRCHLLAQLTAFRAQGLDRGLLVLRPLQARTQPAPLRVRLRDRPAPGRLDAGFGKQLLQARDFRLQGKGILRRAADIPSSLRQPPSVCCGSGQAATSANPRGHGRPPPAQRSSSARASAASAREHSRFGPGMRLLVQGPPVARLARRRRPGGRPNRVVPLGQRQVCPEILVAARHARKLAHVESRYQSRIATCGGVDEGSPSICPITR